MNIYFNDRVSIYIDELPSKEALDILNSLKPLKDNTKEEILSLKETKCISDDKQPYVYTYYMGDNTYAIFGFMNKRNLFILDIIMLVNNQLVYITRKDNEISTESDSGKN